jgi:hypothetical protein
MGRDQGTLGNTRGCSTTLGKKTFHYYISPLLHNMVFMLVFITEISITMDKKIINHIGLVIYVKI